MYVLYVCMYIVCILYVYIIVYICKCIYVHLCILYIVLGQRQRVCMYVCICNGPFMLPSNLAGKMSARRVYAAGLKKAWLAPISCRSHTYIIKYIHTYMHACIHILTARRGMRSLNCVANACSAVARLHTIQERVATEFRGNLFTCKYVRVYVHMYVCI